MKTKELSLKQMENLEGGKLPKWVTCGASIAGAALVVGGLFVIPGGQAALILYAANAIAGPTIAGVGIASSCSSSQLRDVLDDPRISSDYSIQ